MLGWTAAAYAVTGVRVARRGLRAGQRLPALRGEERLAFVLGSPRSGTSFTGAALGSQPGWVDLGEVPPLKAAVPGLVGAPVERQAAAVRRIVERVRLLGLARGLRAVEQNPETAYVLAGALRAYPRATAVHVIRDGRDVVCSLLERGWLRVDRAGGDDARQAYGAHARFWVEPERREEFERASDAQRAAWVWRSYLSAIRSAGVPLIEIRYERLAERPVEVAEELAPALDVPVDALAAALGSVHRESVGRWRRDLDEARRAAWAWRRYVAAARAVPERTVELRYEALVERPDAEADRLAAALDAEAEPLRRAFAEVHASSVGRWRRELTGEQLAEVEAEAGALLAELGYA